MSEKGKRILFITLSVMGVLLMLFFGLRSFRAFKKFGPPPPLRFADELQTDAETIEDWMTIPYISFNYGVPPDALFKLLDIHPKENHKKSLRQLNDEFYPEQDGYVLEQVKMLVLEFQQGHPLLSSSPVATPPSP